MLLWPSFWLSIILATPFIHMKFHFTPVEQFCKTVKISYKMSAYMKIYLYNGKIIHHMNLLITNSYLLTRLKMLYCANIDLGFDIYFMTFWEQWQRKNGDSCVEDDLCMSKHHAANLSFILYYLPITCSDRFLIGYSYCFVIWGWKRHIMY